MIEKDGHETRLPHEPTTTSICDELGGEQTQLHEYMEVTQTRLEETVTYVFILFTRSIVFPPNLNRCYLSFIDVMIIQENLSTTVQKHVL